MTERSASVYILILNWNGWRDTIECLESVFRLDYPDYRVIVCDNGSEDDSIERIEAWAEGRQTVHVPNDHPLFDLSSPPVSKPIRYTECSREHAERGECPDSEARLLLVQTGNNLGYAGGNNVGLRCAMARGDAEYVWLLNNDTVVEPDALGRLVKRMHDKPDAGLCGCTLLHYHEPHTVQALGGSSYNKWLGTIRPVGGGRQSDMPVDANDVERRLSYVIGASMLVSRSFLQSVGLMCEDYFLYFEELDWALRARGKSALGFAPDSIVYHKEGASIGAESRAVNEKSALSDYYALANRLAVTRKFFAYALPTVYLGLLAAALNRLRRGQMDRSWMIIRTMLGSVSGMETEIPTSEVVGVDGGGSR